VVAWTDDPRRTTSERGVLRALRRRGTRRQVPECGRLVCPAAVTTPAGVRIPAAQPGARAAGTRPRVDATGRFVLFVDWYGMCRVLDLHRGKRPRREVRVARRSAWRAATSRSAVVLASGAVVSSRRWPSPEARYWKEDPPICTAGRAGLRGCACARDGTDHLIQVSDGSALPASRAAVCHRRRPLRPHAAGGAPPPDHRVDLVDGPRRDCRPCARPRRGLALATDSAVVGSPSDGCPLHQLPSLEQLGHLRGDGVRRSPWVGLAQRTVAVVGTESSRCTTGSRRFSRKERPRRRTSRTP